VALLTPNMERLIEFSEDNNVSYLGIDDLVSKPLVQQLYAERIAQFNQQLAAYESIKKFILLPREFTVEGGALTPTLKLKRKVIYRENQERIEQLYHSGGPAGTTEPHSDQGGNL